MTAKVEQCKLLIIALASSGATEVHDRGSISRHYQVVTAAYGGSRKTGVLACLAQNAGRLSCPCQNVQECRQRSLNTDKSPPNTMNPGCPVAVKWHRVAAGLLQHNCTTLSSKFSGIVPLQHCSLHQTGYVLQHVCSSKVVWAFDRSAYMHKPHARAASTCSCSPRPGATS